VYDTDANYVAFSAAGAYTVDWGDGTSTSHATGTTAQKLYDYSTIPSSTLSERGYRQVLITITPQSGQNLTSFNMQVLDTTARRDSVSWLDLQINAPNITGTSLTISNSASTVFLTHLERVNISAIGNITSAFNMFNACTSLQSVLLFNTASVTNMNSMFAGCATLTSVPLFNTASVNNMGFMFLGCSEIQSIPLFNTASVTNMGNMFQGCTILQSIPLFNTESVNSMANMFQSCVALQSVPLFNTASVTNMSFMFSACTSLQSIPLFNTASVTNVSFMFQNARALKTIPEINLNSVTTSGNTNGFVSSSTISRCRAINIGATISFATQKLSRTALVEIFNNLKTVSGQTITITGNFGISSLTAADRLIATSKGWTIVE
jgi:surface protein